MKTSHSVAVIMVAAGAFLLAAVAFAAASSVVISTKDGIGNYLADEKGMSLYNFKKDSAGTSVCTGPCVGKWPLFYVEKVEAPEGVKAEDFGSITRSDGKMQTTYKGLPLYYFFKDTKPGDTSGDGFNSVWDLAKP